MKIFTAGMVTESSDLTPIPTTLNEWVIEKPDDPESDASLFRQLLLLFREMANDKGWDVAESICAYALPPGGRSVASAYESIRKNILADLENAMPVDGVLLQLHGASMAYGYDDCEGDLLEGIRTIVGKDIPIGVELDPHCHLTGRMLSNTTLMVLYKTFLHTDIRERAIELFDLFADTLEGKVNPVMATFDCRMADFFDEAHEPMNSFLKTVLDKEKERGILSVSPVHGFPMADVSDMGAKMLVVADTNMELAQQVAASLGQQFYMARGQMAQYGDIDYALDLANEKLAHTEGPAVLVEFSDLAGCGFPTDGTELLTKMMERGLTNLAAGIMWDPLAVEICLSAGVGMTLKLRVGGKASVYSGVPLDLEFTVQNVFEDITVDTWLGKTFLGSVAVICHEDMTLILSSKRVLGYSVDTFRELGVDIEEKDFLVMKYTHEVDSTIFVYGSTFNYRNWGFKNISLPKWPWDSNPLAT